MIAKDMYELGSKRSSIRELFEYGKKRAAAIGAENVFDFSIGNPSVAPPPEVKEAILSLLTEKDAVALHGYTSAQGDYAVRKAICDDVNKRFATDFTADCFYMTAGAAASLTISLKALTVAGDEVITFAPFFPEYRVFVEAAGAKFVVVPMREPDFQIDFVQFQQCINEHTKAVIINSPNNPSGAVYTEKTICELCRILQEKEKEYGHPIYLISDEPYREIVYGDVVVPYVPNYYDDTVVCYSYSKSLSLPGERMGYILVSNKVQNAQEVYAAVCGAGRALGYVCAPSLFQMVVAKCAGMTSDLSVYAKNRDLLYRGLTELGFTCVKPDGAFYLFLKAKEKDAVAFCEKAKKYELLLVPGDDFAGPGYVRISYCVSTEQIERAMPAFAKLAAEYKK